MGAYRTNIAYAHQGVGVEIQERCTGSFFYTTSSIEEYGQYYFLVTDPTFNKKVFLGWIYFPKEEPEESRKQAMRESLRDISYSAASRAAL